MFAPSPRKALDSAALPDPAKRAPLRGNAGADRVVLRFCASADERSWRRRHGDPDLRSGADQRALDGRQRRRSGPGPS